VGPDSDARFERPHLFWTIGLVVAAVGAVVGHVVPLTMGDFLRSLPGDRAGELGLWYGVCSAGPRAGIKPRVGLAARAGAVVAVRALWRGKPAPRLVLGCTVLATCLATAAAKCGLDVDGWGVPWLSRCQAWLGVRHALRDGRRDMRPEEPLVPVLASGCTPSCSRWGDGWREAQQLP
jgi:hypothetical protein